MSNNKQQMTAEMMWNEIDNLFPFKDSVEAQKFCAILDKYKEMEKEQSNAKINIAIKEFETLKSKANSLKDVVYLDGVLAVLDSIKNETYGGGEQ
jgi:hypothetical protein